MAPSGPPLARSSRRGLQSTSAELEGVFQMAIARARFLTPQEVADLLRVSNMTVYRLIKSGELRAVRVGKAYRLLEEDVDAYLAERFTQAG
jgi:excisionase family DNA binding protein